MRTLHQPRAVTREALASAVASPITAIVVCLATALPPAILASGRDPIHELRVP